MTKLYRKMIRKVLPKSFRKTVLEHIKEDVDNSGAIGFSNPLLSDKQLQDYSYIVEDPVITIITPAYNCSMYINDYFNSLFRQTYDMHNIQIIIVDDCSTDDTFERLINWQKRFTGLKILQTNKNSGQAVARNLALDYAIGDYVTFIDPDDFLEEHYFERIVKELKKHPNIKIIGTHPIFYHEANNKYSDTHALKFQFTGKNPKYSLPLDDTSPIILSAAYAVVKRSHIGQLRFDQRIKPTFEDAHFMCRYQMGLSDGLVACLPRAYYLYRKRKDESSSVDKSLEDKRQYDDVLRYGCIDLFAHAREAFGYVPKMVQKRVLYQVMWLYRTYLNNDALAEKNVGEKIARSRELLSIISQDIDPELVAGFNASRFNYELKLAYLRKYNKVTDSLGERAYIRKVNSDKKTIRLLEFWDSRYYINGEEVKPLAKKHVVQNFFKESFLEFNVLEVPYTEETDIFSVRDKKSSIIEISCNHVLSSNFSIGKIKKLLTSTAIDSNYINSGSWILLDRLDRADDNAEFFYRWLKRNHPEQKIKFVLDKHSEDWERLKNDSFDLLAYGTKQWETEIKSSSVIISSQFDQPTFNPFFDGYFSGTKKIVSLQHGIIKDDLSELMNKIPFDMFVTSTKAERNSIVSDNSAYSIMKQDVVLTGLPRHDYLCANQNKTTDRIILVAPTWRRSLFKGSAYHLEIDDNLSESFKQSEYCINWKKLLWSEELKEFAKANSLHIVLKPHPNVLKFISAGYFPVPEHVSIALDENYMDLCSRAELLITDYSSVSFDAAYAGALSIYFQFDRDTFFSQHTYSQGYFCYERDGFGPIADTVDGVIEAANILFESNNSSCQMYRERIDKTFPCRDGKNSERVYNAIRALFDETL